MSMRALSFTARSRLPETERATLPSVPTWGLMDATANDCRAAGADCAWICGEVTTQITTRAATIGRGIRTTPCLRPIARFSPARVSMRLYYHISTKLRQDYYRPDEAGCGSWVRQLRNNPD